MCPVSERRESASPTGHRLGSDTELLALRKAALSGAVVFLQWGRSRGSALGDCSVPLLQEGPVPRSEFGSLFELLHGLAELCFSSYIACGDEDCVRLQLKYLMMDKCKNLIL